MPRVYEELYGYVGKRGKLFKYLEGRFRSDTREETSRPMAEWYYIEQRQSVSFAKDFEDWIATFVKGRLEQFPLSVN